MYKSPSVYFYAFFALFFFSSFYPASLSMWEFHLIHLYIIFV